MLTPGESAKALNSVAELNQAIFRLQGPLRKIARPQDEHPDLPFMANPKEEALKRWDAVITSAVKVQESLMRMAGEKGWVHKAGRVRLSPEGWEQVRKN